MSGPANRRYTCALTCFHCHGTEILHNEEVENLIKEEELPLGWIHCSYCEVDYCDHCVSLENNKCPQRTCGATLCSQCINLFTDTFKCYDCSKLVCPDCAILTSQDDVVFCSQSCLQRSQFRVEDHIESKEE